MKKKLLFTTLFFLSLLSFSQTYKVDEKKIYSWDIFGNDWQHDITEQYTYDNDGNKETNLLALTIPGMESAYQNNKTYNTSNNIILDVRQVWDSGSMQWLNANQTTYTYDGSNNLEEETNQIYNFVTMTYQNSSKELYEYSGTDLTKQTSQIWDMGTNMWVNEEMLEITYSSGLASEGQFSDWNTGTNMWDLAERITRTYNTSDLPILDLAETWNGSSWDNLDRTTYTYSDDLPTELLYQEWNGSSWDNLDRTLNTYDGNDNRTVFIFEEWDSVNSEWKPFYKEESTFSVASPFGLSINSFKNEYLKVYPNPTSDFINISSKVEIGKIEIFNALGSKVLQSNQTHRIDINNLKTGLYILKMYGEDKSESITKRIIIK